jgi:predicted nucleotidyltransferase component of viral defense system
MTPFQARVLGILFSVESVRRNYYFTGGTALAEFYLQHRESDDLDVFTRERRDMRNDYREVMRLLNSEGMDIHLREESDQFVRFVASGNGGAGEGLKVEFCRDAGARMSPATTSGDIIVDSFEDIAVNKVCAIRGRTDVKDYVDLFFILRESEYTIDYLIGRAKEKDADFDREDTVLEFATKLLEVNDLQLHKIRMIKPLTIGDLQSFLIPKAEALIERLRPVGHG